MKYASLAFVALMAGAYPGVAAAQRVTADIRIGSGPVEGRVVVRDPDYRYPRTRVEDRSRYHQHRGYREVEVIRIHGRRGWMHQRGYRAITVWYDSDRDRYFDGRHDDRDGLRAVVIYEREGRFYRDDDRDRHDRDWRDDRNDGRHHRDHQHYGHDRD
jgi:hypothetical protein